MEEIFYLSNVLNNHKIFVHLHTSEVSSKRAYILFNPLFEEKKRVQRFQAELARAICSRNINVIRFDYYASGDSNGELYEFDFKDIIVDTKFLINEFKEKYNFQEVIPLGIRFGADLAIYYSQFDETIKDLVLIEPITDGHRYLVELRIRRKAFYKLNKKDMSDEYIEINGIRYEDQLGIPVSDQVIDFFENWKLDEFPLEDKNINLVKLNYPFSRKRMNDLKSIIAKNNKLTNSKFDFTGFWDLLEPVDTSSLTSYILNIIL